MRMVAIECSSPRHSVALLDGGAVVAEKQWETTPRGGQRVFDRLAELFAEHSVKPADIDVWVSGSGPGNFSGMRVSMAAVKAFGLALDTRIEAVSSGEALALAWMEKQGAEAVGVVGDARRGHLWYGNCRLNGAVVVVEEGWRLCDYIDLPNQLVSGQPCLSSEPDRVTSALEKANISALTLGEAVYPVAGVLGRLAFARMQGECPSEAMLPLYMHEAI